MTDVWDVQIHGGRPAICRNGTPAHIASYCSSGPGWPDRWRRAHLRFIRHGCNVFWLCPAGGYGGQWGVTPFWTGPGEIHNPPTTMPDDHWGLAQQATFLIEHCPDVRLFVRMSDAVPPSWAEAYPDHMQLDCEGKRYDGASLASDIYLAESCRALNAVIGYCASCDWSDRVIGYVYYPIGEGATALSLAGRLFDQSPVMQARFDRWRDERGLSRVPVPTDEGFRQRGEAVLNWPEGRHVEVERDYFALQQQLFSHWLDVTLTTMRDAAGPDRLIGLDAFKANMLGWMTHPIFFGKPWLPHFGDQHLATGTIGMAAMLDRPELDMVVTPHDYRCRWPGFGFDPEGIGDSVTLRGKIMLVEEDQRTYANDERGTFGSIKPGEEHAVFLRNLCASLTRGHQCYPMDVCVGYFEDDRIQQVLADRCDWQRRVLDRPRQDVPCVTMLVDDAAGRFSDFTAAYHELAIIRQRIDGLNHCGVPTRTYLLDDVARDDFPQQHKLFIIPNGYTPQRLAHVREKLFRDGNVIVFGPATAITDGEQVGFERAAELLGMPMRLNDYAYPRYVTIDHWNHPLTADAGAMDTFGDSLRYGPVLTPAVDRDAPPEGVTVLGSIPLDLGRRAAGLVVREFGRGASGNGLAGQRGPGDYAVVFTAAVPLPAWLLRNLARYSGTHVYDEQDDVIFADSSLLAVHAVRPGARTLHLPAPARVTDLVTGAVACEAARHIALQVDAPTTRAFLLDPTRSNQA